MSPDTVQPMIAHMHVKVIPLLDDISQRQLSAYNHTRLTPALPSARWRATIAGDEAMRYRELEFLESCRQEVAEEAAQAPIDPAEFITWFEGLRSTGPGQNDALFPWLANEADLTSMRWFIAQELAGEAGFDDLVALSQLKLPYTAKLEMARNYWDEMGRGIQANMHGLLLMRVADAIGIATSEITEVTEAIALSNLMIGMACNRTYAYHAIGALGVIELTAPGRVSQVAAGLKRLGFSSEQRRYYDLHAALDPLHSRAWNREVLVPLITEHPPVATALAEGALMRLKAGARCFARFREHFAIDPTL